MNTRSKKEMLMLYGLGIFYGVSMLSRVRRVPTAPYKLMLSRGIMPGWGGGGGVEWSGRSRDGIAA